MNFQVVAKVGQKWDLTGRRKGEKKDNDMSKGDVETNSWCIEPSFISIDLLNRVTAGGKWWSSPGTRYIFPLNREARARQTLQADNAHQTNHGNTSTGSPE